MALNSYAGGRFEVVKRGYIGNSFDIDLHSAYPFIISQLPDISKGSWVKVAEVNQDALLGFYRVIVDIPPNKLTPLPFRLGPNLMVYPCGQFETYITNLEYNACFEDIDIKVIRGYEFYDKNPSFPFYNEIHRLYDLKKITPKEDFKYSLIKIIMNSLYGSFYEKHKQEDYYYTGKMFNPIYASLITSGTRALIWNMVKKYYKNIIAIATDGIILDTEPDLIPSNELGNWDLEASGDTIILRSGIYKIGDTIRNRGLSKVAHFSTPHGDFNDIFSYIKNVPELTKYSISSIRPRSMGECLLHTKKLSKEDINVFQNITYNIDINSDHKRIWNDNFKNGGEIFERNIDSLPLFL